MNKNHYLLDWFGRVPDHYELYALPDGKKAAGVKNRISVTTEDEKVFNFEFDFRVPNKNDIPWKDLDNSVKHCCKTCEWDFCRGKNAVYCPSKEGEHREACTAWNLSPDAVRIAMAEYYKKLHEQHYGNTCIAV